MNSWVLVLVSTHRNSKQISMHGTSSCLHRVPQESQDSWLSWKYTAFVVWSIGKTETSVKRLKPMFIVVFSCWISQREVTNILVHSLFEFRKLRTFQAGTVPFDSIFETRNTWPKNTYIIMADNSLLPRRIVKVCWEKNHGKYISNENVFFFGWSRPSGKESPLSFFVCQKHVLMSLQEFQSYDSHFWNWNWIRSLSFTCISPLSFLGDTAAVGRTGGGY
jgi:hypothetical protein